jgi:hypothetical protein
MVSSFLNLGNERIAKRYTHLHPGIEKETIMELFNYQPAFFNWSGADLFHVTNAHGQRRMIVIEVFSSLVYVLAADAFLDKFVSLGTEIYAGLGWS